MGGVQIDTRRATLIVGLQKTARTQTPPIAVLQANKPELWARRAEVIAKVFGKREEFFGHDRADRVAAVVLGAGITCPVAEKSGDGVHRTGLQCTAQDVE